MQLRQRGGIGQVADVPDNHGLSGSNRAEPSRRYQQPGKHCDRNRHYRWSSPSCPRCLQSPLCENTAHARGRGLRQGSGHAISAVGAVDISHYSRRIAVFGTATGTPRSPAYRASGSRPLSLVRGQNSAVVIDFLPDVAQWCGHSSNSHKPLARLLSTLSRNRSTGTVNYGVRQFVCLHRKS
jgi:hypothetical protein